MVAEPSVVRLTRVEMVFRRSRFESFVASVTPVGSTIAPLLDHRPFLWKRGLLQTALRLTGFKAF